MGSLTDDQLRTILLLAVRAPSGDNTQPWTFQWDGNVLTIVFDPARARHVLDAGLSAAQIALGCLIESLAIAASVHGFSIQTDFLGLGAENPGPAAEVKFIDDNRAADPLSDALPRRTTDRRPFRNGSLPVKQLSEISEAFDRRDLISLHLQDSPSQDLIDYILAAESLVAVHPSIFLNTLKWIRFSRQETARTLDGMPWRGTGVGYLEYPALQFMRAFPRSFPFLSQAGMKRIHSGMVKTLIQSSAGLFCISMAEGARTGLMEAGRLAMRVWLRLTQLGFGVQPLTISSLSMYNAKIGVLDSDSARLFGARYSQAENVFRNSFSIPDTNTPVWMLRTGISTSLPKSWLTRRRSLEDTLTIAVTSPTYDAHTC